MEFLALGEQGLGRFLSFVASNHRPSRPGQGATHEESEPRMILKIGALAY